MTWKIVKSHGRRNDQFYWLALDDDPSSYPVLIDAKIDKAENAITVQIEKYGEDKTTREAADEIPFRIYLNDAMLDLDKPVKVIRNGKQIVETKIVRRLSVMMKSLEERGDPIYMFPAEIKVPGTMK